MGKFLATARNLPAHRLAHRFIVHGNQNEIALSREILLGGPQKLRPTGEMDEAIAQVIGRTAENAGRKCGGPFVLPENFVNLPHKRAPLESCIFL